METLKKFVRKKRQLNDLEDEASDIKEELKELKDDVLDIFMEDSIDNISVDGHTAYLHTRDWASINKSTIQDHGEQQVRETLMEIGADPDSLMYPKINTQSFSSFVNEQKELELGEDADIDEWYESLSDDAKEVIDTWTNYDVRVRKS